MPVAGAFHVHFTATMPDIITMRAAQGVCGSGNETPPSGDEL